MPISFQSWMMTNRNEPMANPSNYSQPGNLYTYKSLGTLCDEPKCLTCSFDAAKRWHKAERIDPYPTYEEAAQAVKHVDIDAFIVAGAYPKINFFIMDSELMVSETFVLQIPPL